MNPDEMLNKHADLFKDSFFEKLEKQIQSLEDRIHKMKENISLIKELKVQK